MSLFSKILGNNSYKIYNDAKKKKPFKLERDYLKLVLLNTPPFDYQANPMIDAILDESRNIQELTDNIKKYGNPKDFDLWKTRKRNLKSMRDFYIERNNKFFMEFWRT